MVLPTAERQRLGQIERATVQIPDINGAPGLPFRAIGILSLLERPGTISRDMARAGEEFHDNFRRAMLDGLRAHHPTGLPGAVAGWHMLPPSLGSTHAGKLVAVAIRALGGGSSPAADVAWHVLGLEWSIRRWARERWGFGHVAAGGVLVAALAILAGENNRLTAGNQFPTNLGRVEECAP